MNKGIIITLPRHEYTVDYLTVSSKRIIDEAEKRGIQVKQLKDKDANRTHFEAVIKSLDYRMVVFNGHGSEDTITGHDNLPLIQVGVNESLLKARITFARSCWAGCVLGKECTKNNDGCFIGYELPFMFFIDERWHSNPHKDPIAPIFLEPSNLVAISLIKGNTALEAHEKSKKQTLKTIGKVLRKGSKESFLFAEKLWNNYIGQVLIGNPSACL
jgi:hypothetical protein